VLIVWAGAGVLLMYRPNRTRVIYGIAFIVSALAVVGAGYSGSTRTTSAAILTLNCASTTVTSPFPPTAHDREVFGAVLLPLKYQPQVGRNSPAGHWPYGIKMFLFIRQRARPVLATIPRSSKAAMTWGSSPPVRTVRFKSCSNIGVGANGWTGGLLLKSRTAWVPITFQLGTTRRVVPFWIGRHCD
jgi:hypothetical protein